MNTVAELAFNAIVDVIGWTFWAITGILMLTVVAACKPIAIALDFAEVIKSA